MKKIFLLAWIVLLLLASIPVQAQSIRPDEEPSEITGSGSYEANRYRSGRGSYTGGRSGVTTPPRTPAATNPRTSVPPGGAATAPARGIGWGGLFGGLAAGAILGSILNPFGFFGGMPFTGFSIIGLLFWGAILFLIYRWFKRMRNTNH